MIPDWGTKIPLAAWHGQKKRKRAKCIVMDLSSVSLNFYPLAQGHLVAWANYLVFSQGHRLGVKTQSHLPFWPHVHYSLSGWADGQSPPNILLLIFTLVFILCSISEIEHSLQFEILATHKGTN